MKKIYAYILAAAGLFAAASCQEIVEPAVNGPEVSGETFSLTAVAGTCTITEDEMEEIRALHNFESAYSFAVIGDTQYTTRRFPDLMPTLYNWIAENVDAKGNSFFVVFP